MTARSIAARVIARTLEDGAFAAAVLEAELERSRLDERDRAFATELALGALRVFPWLEQRLSARAPRGYELPAIARAHLAVAAYQLFFLRTPAHAAVDEAVEAVRRSGHAKLAGFANAILRRVAAEARADDPNRRAEAARASTPAWLRAALERSLGPRADAYLLADPPPVCLRVERGDRARMIEELREERPRATFEAGSVSPLAILARGAGRAQSLTAVREARASLQEEGSQVVALALGARSGERVLDACAGRGGKTAILARASEVTACDLHASKIDRLGKELARLGLRARGEVIDFTKGADLGAFDRVLVDAPCSGSGTLRRRPDIALRRGEEDIARLARTQLAILGNAAAHARPGGRVVYAVCSVLREEGDEIADLFLATNAAFVPAPFDSDLAVLLGATRVRLDPIEHGTDGYFLASFVRVP